MTGAIVIEGHVQGLSNTRSLGELGIPVYVVDTGHCLAQHSRYCKKYFKCPSFNTPEFIDFLLSLAKKESLDGWFLIGSNDHVVENLSMNSDRLQPFYKMLVPDRSQLYEIINKKNLLTVAKACGTSIPETCYPELLKTARSFRFPLLVKGNLGLSFYKATHKKAIQVDDYQQLVGVIGQLREIVPPDDIMIQELIPGTRDNQVVSFTCFAEHGDIKTFWMGKKLREHPIKYGTATCAVSVYEEDVLREAIPLVKALSYTGMCEIEFMLDERDGKYKLIEINPRTWLWVGLAKACGVDYAKIMYRYVNGTLQAYPQKYEIGTKWINWITDIYFGLKAIRNKILTFNEYLSSLRGRKITAVWSWKDPWPGIVFPFMLFYIARKRG